MAPPDYQPTRRTPGENYNAFLDQLGFKTDANIKRTNFIDDLTKHVDYSTFRYVRQQKNPLEFKKMVLDFFTKHGEKYWGLTERNHLSEIDPNKGFLCPRDAARTNSRLVMVLTSMFNYKAGSLCRKDAKKDSDKRVLSSINEQMIWPPNDNIITELRGSKRCRIEIPRQADYDSDEPLKNVLERNRNTGFRYTVAQSSWRPNTSYRAIQISDDDDDEPIVSQKRKRGPKAIVIDDGEEDDQTIALRESMRASSITPARTTPFYDSETGTVYEAPRKPAVTNRGFSYVFGRNSRATKRNDVAQATRPNSQVETNGDDNNLGVSYQSNGVQSTHPNPQVETNGDDNNQGISDQSNEAQNTGPIPQVETNGDDNNLGASDQSTGAGYDNNLRVSDQSTGAQNTRPNLKVETNDNDNNVGVSDQSNGTQSTRPKPTVESQDGDDDIMMLESQPSTWQKHNKVKQETVTVKQEQLAVEITYGTRLVVEASNQPGMAPVNIPLGSVPSIENLFILLATACELRPIEMKKITAVSVHYTWSGERQRLRKGRSEDWEYFNRVLSKEYERNPTRFEESCNVDMMLHVDT